MSRLRATLALGLAVALSCGRSELPPIVATTSSPTDEVCDGRDNDDDGQIDEGLGQTTCGTWEWECRVTVDNCVDGVEQTCIPACDDFCADRGTAQAFDAFGSGSASDPFQICTAEQWVDIGNNPSSWNAHFRLRADIDLSAVTAPHPAIGTDINPFLGTMDGGRHVIHNFTNTGGATNFGLFGYVSGDAASIGHIALIDPNVLGGPFSGGLVGYLESGRVFDAAILGDDCNVRSSGYANHRACLIGETRPGTSIENVFGACDFSGGGGGTGGLIGHHEGSSVTNCYFVNSGVLTNSGGNYFGGLVGWNLSSTVTACFSNTDVHGDNSSNTVGILTGAGSASNGSYYASNRTCINDGGDCRSDGTGVDLTADPDYFFDANNPPMSEWDFVDVWTERPNDYPILIWLAERVE